MYFSQVGSVPNLKKLHTPELINPFAKYRVDTIKLGLIELPKPPEIRNQ